MTWWGKEFQGLIACGKKENLYESILAYNWVNLLLMVPLVKGGESTRMWNHYKIINYLKEHHQVSWSHQFSKESHPKSSNIVTSNTGESCKIIKDTDLTAFITIQLGDQLQSFSKRKAELSVLDGCVLWKSRVIVPPPGRQSVLEELHDTLMRWSHWPEHIRIWWPNINKDIEDLARSCLMCQQTELGATIAS